MNIKRITVMSCFVAVVIVALVAIIRNQPAQTTDKVTVTASFYPLYDFAKLVGGSHVTVTNVTPAGAEPHDYEPSPRTLTAAQQSAVFIYNGGTLEPWATKFLHDYTHVAVRASDHITLESGTSEDEEHTQDPHFWLDPFLAQQIVRNIRDGLVKADPSHATDYKHNAAVAIAKLQQLDRDFATGLKTCDQRTIITSHQAFGYLAKRYNIHVEAISGVSPDQEPSAASLASLTTLARQQNIHYIFFESLVSPRLADTIAREVGAQTLVFDPLEGLTNEEQSNGKNYFNIQRENLANLRTALTCR